MVGRAREKPREARKIPPSGTSYDAIVVGAGFGGLGAALTLAERGERVLVCEALGYPGGCASTFQRDGFRFDAGATLVSGLAADQVFGRWIRRHDLAVEVDAIDPLVVLRAPGLTLPVPRRREGLVEALERLHGAEATRIRAFFERQRKLADLLWELVEQPELLPPLGRKALRHHFRNAPRWFAFLGLVGRPLARVLRSHGLEGFRPLVIYLDALCQITVQCGSAEAEAPFALGAMDYYYRGTGHVRGGVGALAWALVRAIRSLGGEVAFGHRVQRIAPAETDRGPCWKVETSHGAFEAPFVAANVLPQAARALLDVPGTELRALERDARRVEEGWGACMLYLIAREPDGARPEASHLQLVRDPDAPMAEGNHVFVSISAAGEEARAPKGMRAITASTHVRQTELHALAPESRAEKVRQIQEAMCATIRELAPEWWRGVEHEMTASPRTFERFTGRTAGYVGGVPRRAGLASYTRLLPRELAPGLYLVGDTNFPGQSVQACAIGGIKTAERILEAAELRRLGIAPSPRLAVRLGLTAAGLASVGLGLLGVVLPGLPTTPFMLLAAACFVRSSPRLHARLLESRAFGPTIRDFREGRGIPRRVKVWALLSMWAFVTFAVLVGIPSELRWVKAVVLVAAAIGTFVVARLKVYAPASRNESGQGRETERASA